MIRSNFFGKLLAEKPVRSVKDTVLVAHESHRSVLLRKKIAYGTDILPLG